MVIADLDQGVFEEILVIPYVGKDETHFPELKKRLGVDYRDMLFFDDEHGNIKSVSSLVHSCGQTLNGRHCPSPSAADVFERQ